jgi:PAS domain S-box-containing protein
MVRWREMPVQERVAYLRWSLPLAIMAIAVLYQLGFARSVEENFGHDTHYLVEVLFYGLVGPTVTWVTLTWISRWLAEKEEAERRVREQERTLASITTASADAIISLDPAGVIRSWNRGAHAIFGYPPEAVIGQPFDILLQPEMREDGELARIAAGVERKGFLQDYETAMTTADGRTVSVSLTWTRLHDEEGLSAGSSVILRDVTWRKEQQAIVDEERTRIARELHDGLAQDLFFLRLKIDQCRKLLQSDPTRRSALADELTAIKASLQRSLRDVRRAIFALRPLDLERLGFFPALRKFVEEFGEQNEVAVTLDVRGPEAALPSRLEPTLFRLIQESLNNVAKHAAAQQAQVVLDLTRPEAVLLSVCDNGHGFASDASRDNGHHAGLGLVQMRERVEAAGGTFMVESAPGAGTRVSAFLSFPGN